MSFCKIKTGSAKVLLQGLGACYSISFISVLLQYAGLLGSKGILPALGHEFIPFYDFIYIAGLLVGLHSSIRLLFGNTDYVHRTLPLLLYYFVVQTGHTFFAYAWDVYLVELGFLGLLVNLGICVRKDRIYSLGVLCSHFLLARLMYGMGLVKVLSVDPAWRDGSFLHYFFVSQPMPSIFAWYFEKIPQAVLSLFTVVTPWFELLTPVFLIGGFFFSRLRLIVVWSGIALQVGICFSGNYGIFNLLAITQYLAFWKSSFTLESFPLPMLWKRLAVVTAGLWFVIWSMMVIGFSLRENQVAFNRRDWIEASPILFPLKIATELNLTAPYDLFSNIPRDRQELRFWYTEDGTSWVPIFFLYKPDDPMSMPKFFAPYQSRLDHQVFYETIRLRFSHEIESDFLQFPWIRAFCLKLLQRESTVWSLLQPGQAIPEHIEKIKVSLHDYRFSTTQEKQASGAWWQDTYLREYLQVTQDKN